MPNKASQMPLRIPQSLHAELKMVSDFEGISLNQYCLYILTKYSGSNANYLTQKGESLLRFISEAFVFQQEINKKSGKKKIQLSAGITPQQRYLKLYGQHRKKTH